MDCCVLWNDKFIELLMIINRSDKKEDWEKNSDEAALKWKKMIVDSNIKKHMKEHGINREDFKIINMLNTLNKMNDEIESYKE